MTEGLIFNGKKYLPSKQAADLTGYEMDYVGQLCRSGKVESKRIGRVWFVGEESILDHKKRAVADTGSSKSQPTEKMLVAKSPKATGFASTSNTANPHKSDTNPETSLPSHFHLFGEVKRDSMTKLLSLFVISILFSSILVAKEVNSFPLAYDYLKSASISDVANVELASVRQDVGTSNKIKSSLIFYWQNFSGAGENILALGDFLGRSYLEIINQSSKVAGLFTDSGIAGYPKKIFTAGGESFVKTYQKIGSNFQQDFTLAINSKLVAGFAAWPQSASRGVALSIQTFPRFYQNLGLNLRDKVARAFNQSGPAESKSFQVASVAKSERGDLLGWLGQRLAILKSQADNLATQIISRLRVVRGAVASGFNQSVSQLGSLWRKVKNAPVALYQSVSRVFSSDYYLQLTQSLNRNQGESEENVGGVFATEPNPEVLGIAVVPSVNELADEIAKKQIKDSFSDEVEVIPDATGQSGIIRPNFKSGRSSAYVYVLVPVKQ